MYIVKKKIGNRDYYYLRESKREGRKVRAVTLAYLGRTRKEAEEKMRKFESKGKQERKMEEKMIKEEKKIERKPITIEEIASFCKRKGFVYQSGEIYGGLAGFWDFGPYGVELKNNIKQEWWNFFVREREDIVGIDGAVITHPHIWKASGHVESFTDVSVICKKCQKINKAERSELDKAVCSFCGGELDKKNAKSLNLMFSTQVSPSETNSIKAFLRPETAQLIFANFKNVAENARMKLPFGIAQIGKAFRNEIAPRDFLFRSREFEQMEIEYFILPDQECSYKIPGLKIAIYSAENQQTGEKAKDMKIRDALANDIIKRDWHAFWLSQCLLWFQTLGCDLKNFRIRQHAKDELAHYSSDCWDIEYLFPFGWKELIGIADRADYDLTRHEKFSGQNLKIFVEGRGKILPHVVCEPSFGVDRVFLVLLLEAYKYDEKRQNIVLSLNPRLAPIKAAVLPIVKGEFEKLAREVYLDLKKEFNVVYDSGGSIGRRYSRNDEIGTVACITVDSDSLKDNTATIRDRDTTEQVRVKISELKDIMRKVINEGRSILEFGKRVNTRVKEE